MKDEREVEESDEEKCTYSYSLKPLNLHNV